MAVAVSQLLLPRQSSMVASSILMIPTLLFYTFGLGFFHLLLDSSIGSVPWSSLLLLPIWVGLFLGILSGLSLTFHPWTTRLFWLGITLSLITNSDISPAWLVIVVLFRAFHWARWLEKSAFPHCLRYCCAGLIFRKSPERYCVWLTPHHIPNRDSAQFPQERWSAWGHHSVVTTEGMSFCQ